jgi:hypothetical protein
VGRQRRGLLAQANRLVERRFRRRDDVAGCDQPTPGRTQRVEVVKRQFQPAWQEPAPHSQTNNHPQEPALCKIERPTRDRATFTARRSSDLVASSNQTPFAARGWVIFTKSTSPDLDHPASVVLAQALVESVLEPDFVSGVALAAWSDTDQV